MLVSFGSFVLDEQQNGKSVPHPQKMAFIPKISTKMKCFIVKNA